MRKLSLPSVFALVLLFANFAYSSQCRLDRRVLDSNLNHDRVVLRVDGARKASFSNLIESLRYIEANKISCEPSNLIKGCVTAWQNNSYLVPVRGSSVSGYFPDTTSLREALELLIDEHFCEVSTEKSICKIDELPYNSGYAVFKNGRRFGEAYVDEKSASPDLLQLLVMNACSDIEHSY